MLAPLISTFRFSVVLNDIAVQSRVAEYKISHQLGGALAMLERDAVPAAVKYLQARARDELGHYRRRIGQDNRIFIAVQDQRRCTNLAESVTYVMLRNRG